MLVNYILFAIFCFNGTLVRREKTLRYSARKVTGFGLLMTDIPINVSCKFEMYMFEFALVMNENVLFAFLNAIIFF